ncbi:MAG: hypothetical protein FWC13_03640 [Oscillospiraceae bacterium]|nr:hypothetical protein [Oscillospiraceae bacterium]MCL2248338.1 hypothetical protein [Oscillospiraceae bacterium]
MKKIIFVVALTLLLIFSLTACDMIGDIIGGGSGPVVSPTPGEWNDRIFTSEYMGFRFALPALWDAPTDSQWADLMEAGAYALGDMGIELSEEQPTLYMVAMNNITGANVQITYHRYGRRTPSLDEVIDTMTEELTAAGMRVVGTRRSVQLGAYNWTYVSVEFNMGDTISRSQQFYSIYSGYIRIITITSLTGTEELAEIMSMFIGLDDRIPESVAIELSEDLIDSWFLDEELDFVYIYMFAEDGTGIRGFVDEEADFQWIDSAYESFMWRTYGDTLLIITDVGTEGWEFTVDGHEITIDSLQEPGLSFSLFRLSAILDGSIFDHFESLMDDLFYEWFGHYEWFDNVYFEIPEDASIDMNLVGLWVLLDNDNVTQEFFADGYGVSNLEGQLDTFEWGIADDGRLLISFWWTTENWSYTIEDDVLLLDSISTPGWMTAYVRIP